MSKKKKSPAQRIEWLEQRAIGMGFLLLKVKAQFGAELGIGMTEQINQAIADYRSIERTRSQREAAAMLKAQHDRLAREDGAAA